jgi:hypothetical protein
MAKFSSSDIPVHVVLSRPRTCLNSDLCCSVSSLTLTFPNCEPPSFVPVVLFPTPFSFSNTPRFDASSCTSVAQRPTLCNHAQ